MEKRKVKRINGEYQILKLRNDKYPGVICWNNYGKSKSLKAIVDLLDSGRFELEISENIKEEINEYRKEQARRSRIYFYKKGLESKTI